MQVKYEEDRSIKISQLFLLKRIIETLPRLKDANPTNISTLSVVILNKDTIVHVKCIAQNLNIVAEVDSILLAYSFIKLTQVKQSSIW